MLTVPSNCAASVGLHLMIAPWKWEVAASPKRQLSQDSCQMVAMTRSKMLGQACARPTLACEIANFLINVVQCVFMATVCKLMQ